MFIDSKVIGPVQTNCYLLGDEITKHAALIDPGDQGRTLVHWAQERGYQVTMILLTHGHFDHINGVKAAQETLSAPGTEVPVYVHKADYPVAHCGFLDNVSLRDVKNIVFYDEGDTVLLDSISIQVLHTPGHTRGGVCLIAGNAMFSGDTLFCGSCGRTDFPDSSPVEIMESLKRLSALPGDYQVYPGHDRCTTLKRERERNPYMQYAMKNL